MKHFAIMFAVLLAVSAMASAQQIVTWGGGTSYKVSSRSAPPIVTAVPMSVTPVPVAYASTPATVAGGINGHLDSYRRPQEVVGEQELRVENDRTDNYVRASELDRRATQDAQRFAIERARLDQQMVRDAQRYEIERRREVQRSAESWSRMINDWRRQSARQAEDQRRANDRERERISRSLKDLGQASADLGKAWAQARPKPATRPR